MKLSEKINLNKIIFDLYKKDLNGLINNKDFNLSDEQKNELIILGQTNECKTLFERINNFFEKNINNEPLELSLMLTLILQRYNYFYKTELQWKEYCTNFENIEQKNPGEFFLTYISQFFDDQINLYNNSYLEIVEEFNIEKWNKNFSSDINKLLKNINNSSNFQEKMQNCENMILFLQDTKNIYSSLESVGVENEKQQFLAHTNELKIIYQSLNHLINEILKDIIVV
ncbi:hypothetical protein [Spiroplasma floricola]|uniref:Uncharacterized protein n=1 Tax=Spiroplasma floricola 23-6 TaxID=1336749 RepID=A0A2K8SFM6_9MOLU|nr:hypothetical protein [Spiroplasma floricola]AUB31630.1 hypothetical protein SFLOR_v1c05780 [Spiroplasma floricola 23-6]